MFREFREFIARGNVLDLAVAVVIGGAFNMIVTSLTDDILMPIIGIFLGGIDFSALTIEVGDATLQYGNFIQAIINFLIIAFALFLIIRSYNQLYKRLTGPEEATPLQPPEEIKLLREIRDLLKTRDDSI